MPISHCSWMDCERQTKPQLAGSDESRAIVLEVICKSSLAFPNTIMGLLDVWAQVQAQVELVKNIVSVVSITALRHDM